MSEKNIGAICYAVVMIATVVIFAVFFERCSEHDQVLRCVQSASRPELCK